MEKQVTIIPAQPGYKLVAIYDKEKRVELDQVVVGWWPYFYENKHGHEEFGLFPVTDSRGTVKYNWAVIRPDGTVFDWVGENYGSYPGFFAELELGWESADET